MNEPVFNKKTPRRKDASRTEESQRNPIRCRTRGNAETVSLFASSRLCALALSLFITAADTSLTVRAADLGKVLYQNDFSKGEIGKLPEEMLLLDGGFAVREINGNNVL